MSEQYGLIHAFLLDGNGSGRDLDTAQIEQWTPDQGILWLHFDYTHPDAEQWLMEKSGLEHIIASALVVDETRPRANAINDGLLMALRGINHNQGAEPDDMISLRMWIDQSSIYTCRKRKLGAANDIIQQLRQGYGPKNSGDFLVAMIDGIVEGMSETISSFEENVADYEDAVLEGNTGNLRYELATLRRQAITIRRYLAPERDAFSRLLIEKMSWLDNEHQLQIREVNDHLLRHIENLDAIRERAAVTQEELLNRLSEQMNARMYVLSVVAAVFLPLGFLTGLLGVNIGGIPGTENDSAFWLFNLVLVAVVVVQVILFRWRNWF